MPAKGEKEPLHKVVGSSGKKNDAIKNYFRRLLGRRGAPGAKP